MKPSFPQSQSSPSSSGIALPLWILAIIAGGALLREASTISIWILSSFFLLALLDPWMQRLERKGIAPVISAVSLISLVTIMTVAGAAVIYHFSSVLSEVFSTYRKTLVHLYEAASSMISQEVQILSRSGGAPAASPLAALPQADPEHSPIGGEVGASLVRGLGTAFTAIVFAVLCPILTFFMVAERKTLATAFGRLFDGGMGGSVVWKKITQATGAFFLGNLTLCLCSFPVFCLVFRCFGVGTPYALAAVASILNLVPFLGAGLSGMLPVLDLLSKQEASPALAAGLVLTCMGIHFTIANLVTPKILGSKVDLNATTSTIALVAWGELLGGVGLLLAIPITATLKILFQHSQSTQLRWVALLMSDDPESSLNQSSRQFALNLDSVNRLGSALGIKVGPEGKDGARDVAAVALTPDRIAEAPSEGDHP
jgi:predicted PurR-regulated permease PerM